MTRFITVPMSNPEAGDRKVGTASGLAIVRQGLALHRTVLYGFIEWPSQDGMIMVPMFHGEGWTITHVPSGLRVNNKPIPRADVARDILRHLLAEFPSWDMPHERFTTAQNRALRRMITVYGLR